MIEHSVNALGQVANASQEEASGIAQVNTGIDQMSQVVQMNAATAEETAATTEELSSQSEMLKRLATQFKLKHADGAVAYPARQSQRRVQTSRSQSPVIALPANSAARKSGEIIVSDSEFGKY